MDEIHDRVTLKSRARLASWMSHRKLRTAYAVAKAAGLRSPSGRVADGRIQHLVSGRRKTCRLDTALAIAEALDVPVDALFRIDECAVHAHPERSRAA